MTGDKKARPDFGDELWENAGTDGTGVVNAEFRMSYIEFGAFGMTIEIGLWTGSWSQIMSVVSIQKLSLGWKSSVTWDDFSM